MKKDNYKHYFAEHYKLTLHEQDIINYERWFIAQWHVITQQFTIKKNSQLLEIGSGVGGVYSMIKKQTPVNYEGIELDKQAVAFTNKYFSTNVFKHISFEAYKTQKKYDAVLAFEVLEHLSNPYDAIKKIYDLLKRDGVFIGTSPYPFAKNVYADKTHLHVLHPDNWKRLFLYAGFKEVTAYPMSFFPYLWRVHPQLNIRLPFYVPFPGFISTALLIAKKETHEK